MNRKIRESAIENIKQDNLFDNCKITELVAIARDGGEDAFFKRCPINQRFARDMIREAYLEVFGNTLPEKTYGGEI